jgi:hypothetical protein
MRGQEKKGKRTQDEGKGKKGNKKILCVILFFHRDVDEICALLGHYTTQGGNSIPTFRDNLSVRCSGTTTRCITTQKSAGVKGKVLKS